jgi:hypothetical protein
VGHDIDVLETGLLGAEAVAPSHELAEHASERQAAGGGRLLVIPIVENDAEFVVAGPDDRDHLGEVGVECVAQGLQPLRVGEDTRFRLATEAVNVEQHLAVA